ncbi:MAG: alpha/beta fold hydrolase [Anaerolineales bacterium]
MSLLNLLYGERLPLDEAARRGMPGGTARLTDGVTYYEMSGGKGTPVVLIHGFSVPNFIWDLNFSTLAEAGFRVVRYDVFGRGYSDRPKIRNDKALFVRQLADLLDALKIEQADLVSLSMGAVVAAEFAFRFPKRVRKLVFIDPAGFELALPFAFRLLYVPMIGEMLLGILGLLGSRSLLQSMLNDFYDPTEEARNYFVPRYLEQMKFQGFKRSLLSTLRARLLEEDLTLFKGLGELQKPVLLIWGEADPTVPFRHHETFLKLVPQTEFHAIQRAGHIPHFERPEAVNPLLVGFLAR